ncbi:MAG: P-loop NTPase fold protein [Pseudomonadota bacterium]
MAGVFRAREIEIPEDYSANDRLGRREQVESLAALVEHIGSPMVIGVDAPWGTGKTTFVKMLQSQLRLQDVPTIYFNAWESDFANDPLVAFIGEIDSEVGAFIDGDAGREKAWKKIRDLSGKVARHAIPAALKLATYGILDKDAIAEDVLADGLAGLSLDLVAEYQSSKQAVLTFRENVEKVLAGRNDGPSHLVVIIDELDRCRPTFSIELLERVKHLFGVSGVVFIVAIDREQLGHSIRAVYGEGFDAQTYLRRFVDISYRLQTADLSSFHEGLFEQFGLDEIFVERAKQRTFQHERQHVSILLSTFVQFWELTLRDVEQLVAQLNIVIRTAEDNTFLYPPITLFLLLLRVVDPKLYRSYLDSKQDPMIVLNYLDEKFEGSWDRPDCLAWVEGAFLDAYTNETFDAARHERERRLAIANDANGDATSREYNRRVCRCAAQPIGSQTPQTDPIIIDHLIARIEFLERIDVERG